MKKIKDLKKEGMVCKECEKCWNYMVCENGCYGSDKPCEYFISDVDN